MKLLDRRCYRQKKKEKAVNCDPIKDVSKAHQTPQAFGKAVSKVKKTPTKKSHKVKCSSFYTCFQNSFKKVYCSR